MLDRVGDTQSNPAQWRQPEGGSADRTLPPPDGGRSVNDFALRADATNKGEPVPASVPERTVEATGTPDTEMSGKWAKQNLMAAGYSTAKNDYKPNPEDMDGVFVMHPNVLGVHTTTGEYLAINSTDHPDAYKAAITNLVWRQAALFGPDYKSDNPIRDKLALAGFAPLSKDQEVDDFGVKLTQPRDDAPLYKHVEGVGGAYVEGDWAALILHSGERLLVNKNDHPMSYETAQNFYWSRMDEIV